VHDYVVEDVAPAAGPVGKLPSRQTPPCGKP